MNVVETTLGAIVGRNNRAVASHASDRFARNPRDVDSLPWHRALVAAYPTIRAEWDAFAGAGQRLPRIEDLIDEHQGNEGDWRAGLLVSRGRPIGPLGDRFPRTLAALAQVPGLWSALWSELDAGTELPAHEGPNAGMLRYHLGIDCGDGAALQVGDRITPYRDGEGILFDDTVTHAAWNRGERPRITLFCEILRPVDGPVRFSNLAVQRLLSLDARYRRAPARAGEWDRTLNGGR